MKSLSKKNTKKLIMTLAICGIITNIGHMVSAASYVFYLPEYQGVTQDKNSAASKFRDAGKGYNNNYEVTGSGSYAMDYYMSNSNNERKGEYKTIDSGYDQTFDTWGVPNKTYYLTAMNYSSVSSKVISRGTWAPDVN